MVPYFLPLLLEDALEPIYYIIVLRIVDFKSDISLLQPHNTYYNLSAQKHTQQTYHSKSMRMIMRAQLTTN